MARIRVRSWLESPRARRAFVTVLIQLAVCALILCGTVVALVVAAPLSPTWLHVLFPLVGAVWFVAGAVAWLRRPSNRVGAILTGGALVWFTVALENTGLPALVAVALVFATVPLAVVVHLLVAFPSGRLADTRSRALVAAAYVVALVLQAPLYLFAGPPVDVLQVADRTDLAEAGEAVQALAGTVVLGLTGLVLAGRLRAASAPQRRALTPLYGYGIAAVALVPIMANVLRPAVLSPVATAVLQLAVLALIPVAFAGSIIRGGFARTAEVEELGAWLGAEQDRRLGLREVLAATLGDPSVELAFWVPPGYVDTSGRPVVMPAPGDGRQAVHVELGGDRVGAIVYDTAAIPDAELVRSTGRVIAIEVDRQRLTAELRASREALRESRRRLVEAGDRQQRRIAQDLHDGLQSRLVVLALQAHSAGATHVRLGIEEAIADLRSLVAGMMPPLLLERGLYAAMEDLVSRVPLSVQLKCGPRPGPLPAGLEQVAYFVVSEALTNAVKHSHARAVSVRLDHAPERLRLEICDDGIGGATLTEGAGLRGMADRVDVAGGQLRVDSPDGHGTCVVVELPCAS